MTRMKKMTMKKSSLRGSDPAWVHKADFYGQGEQIRSHSSSSGGLIGPWRLCQETVKAERPWLAAYHPPSSALLFSSGRGGGPLWKPPATPFPLYTDPPSQSAPSPLPFHLLHKRVLLFLETVLSPPPSTCADQLEFLLKTTVVPGASLLL